jgi:hypothetical protein
MSNIWLRLYLKHRRKFVFVHATNACRKSRGIAPLIPNLGTRWRWLVSIMSRLLYPGDTTPSTYRIGGWVGFRASQEVLEKRKFCCTCRIRISGCPASSVDTIPTELSRLPVCIYPHLKLPTVYLQCFFFLLKGPAADATHAPQP